VRGMREGAPRHELAGCLPSSATRSSPSIRSHAQRTTLRLFLPSPQSVAPHAPIRGAARPRRCFPPHRNGRLPRRSPPPLPRHRRAPARPPRRLRPSDSAPPFLRGRGAASADADAPAASAGARRRAAQDGGRLLVLHHRRCRRGPKVVAGSRGRSAAPGRCGLRGGAGEGPPRVAAPRGCDFEPSSPKSASIFARPSYLREICWSCMM
jgi:hypothetical protein